MEIVNKYLSQQLDGTYRSNVELYRQIAKRSPTVSNISGSEADREERRQLFDEFLQEEFDNFTDIEDEPTLKEAATKKKTLKKRNQKLQSKIAVLKSEQQSKKLDKHYATVEQLQQYWNRKGKSKVICKQCKLEKRLKWRKDKYLVASGTHVCV